jgi:tetratricopeptide (TPR) repeat protein
MMESEGTVRSQLEKVLGSPGFARNERLSRFLRFIVERHLEKRYDDLKESVIGIEVFDRKPDYDPRADPVVRTEARRLRARLAQYYEGVGVGDAVVIDLPKGGYVPVVRLADQGPQNDAPAPGGSSPSSLPRRHLPALVLGSCGLLLAAIAWIDFGSARRSRPSSSSPAYDLYLRARSLEMRPAVRGVEASIDFFEQAIAKDSSFAPAYAGVAAAEAARSAFDRFSPPERAEMLAKGWSAVKKAMALDPRLADARDALGMMQARQGQWQEAERSFRRAIQLAPHDPLWRQHFAVFFLMPLGRTQEAIAQLRTAEDVDPTAGETHYALNVALRAVGRFDDAEFHCHRAAENDRQMSECWAETLPRQGKANDAVRALEEVWNGHLLEIGSRFLGVAYARAGRRQDAERLAAIVPHPASKALIFAALGDKDRTFDYLDQMLPMGPTRVGRELISPEYAFLRGDPRLRSLRKSAGLPN